MLEKFINPPGHHPSMAKKRNVLGSGVEEVAPGPSSTSTHGWTVIESLMPPWCCVLDGGPGRGQWDLAQQSWPLSPSTPTLFLLPPPSQGPQSSGSVLSGYRLRISGHGQGVAVGVSDSQAPETHPRNPQSLFFLPSYCSSSPYK